MENTSGGDKDASQWAKLMGESCNSYAANLYKNLVVRTEKLVNEQRDLMLNAMFGSQYSHFSMEKRRDWTRCMNLIQALVDEFLDLNETVTKMAKKHLTDDQYLEIEQSIMKSEKLPTIDQNFMIQNFKFEMPGLFIENSISNTHEKSKDNVPSNKLSDNGASPRSKMASSRCSTVSKKHITQNLDESNDETSQNSKCLQFLVASKSAGEVQIEKMKPEKKRHMPEIPEQKVRDVSETSIMACIKPSLTMMPVLPPIKPAVPQVANRFQVPVDLAYNASTDLEGTSRYNLLPKIDSCSNTINPAIHSKTDVGNPSQDVAITVSLSGLSKFGVLPAIRTTKQEQMNVLLQSSNDFQSPADLSKLPTFHDRFSGFDNVKNQFAVSCDVGGTSSTPGLTFRKDQSMVPHTPTAPRRKPFDRRAHTNRSFEKYLYELHKERSSVIGLTPLTETDFAEILRH